MYEDNALTMVSDKFGLKLSYALQTSNISRRMLYKATEYRKVEKSPNKVHQQFNDFDVDHCTRHVATVIFDSDHDILTCLSTIISNIKRNVWDLYRRCPPDTTRSTVFYINYLLI